MTRFGGSRRLWILPAVILAAALFLAASHLGTGGEAQAQPPYPGPCDVNSDSAETIQDALLIAQHVVGLITLSPPACPPPNAPCDCNGDGNVTISDALLVAQRVVGLV